MSEIVLRGTFVTLWDDCVNILNVLRNRVIEGYPVLMDDEEWVYHTFPSRAAVAVCPTCEAYDKRVFIGNEVASEFPDYVFVDSHTIRPRVHLRDGGLANFFGEPCHCELHWENSEDCIEPRLHSEKLEVIT